MSDPVDSWQSGNSYDRFMGRWSRLVAQEFLQWLSVPENGRWLDIGCGTGVLSSLILNLKRPQQILAIDASPEFITFARSTHEDPRLRFEAASAESIPAVPNYFDAVVSGLALNFIPQPGQVMVEMKRVAKPGRFIAAYLWDYADGMQMLRYFWDAVVALDSSAAALDEGSRFPLCREGELERLFRESALSDVQVKAIEVPTLFANFEDYWQPFLGGVGPAPGYVLNLDTAEREALKKRLRSSLPQSDDGTIAIQARAWAVQGIV